MKYPLLLLAYTFSIFQATAQNSCTEDIGLLLVEAINDGPYCPEQQIILTGSGSSSVQQNIDLSYWWTGPNNYSSNEQNPMDATEEGIYQLVISNGECTSNIASTEVQFYDAEKLLQIEVKQEGSYCLGSPILLTGSGSSISDRPITYFWTGPEGYTSTVQSPTDAIAVGNYELTASIENCISKVVTTEVKEKELSGSISGPNILNEGESIDLVLHLSGADFYNVSFAFEGEEPFVINNIIDGFIFSVTPKQSGVYSILNIEEATGGNCEFSIDDGHRVLVRQDSDPHLYFPNAFSPNNDGINDVFFPYADEHIQEIKEFKIFDRWGNLIFERYDFFPNDSFSGWDGSFKNQVFNSGGFVYFAKALLLTGREIVHSGEVSLIRN